MTGTEVPEGGTEALTSDLEQQVSGWPERARLMLVTDQLSYEGAGHALIEIKALREEVADTFDPICKATDAAHKEAVAQRKRHDRPLVEGESILKSAIAFHQVKQERLRRLEEEKVNAKARQSEEAALRVQAAQAKRLGATQGEVDDILTQPSVAPTVVLPPRVAAVSGVSMRDAWSAEVIDLKALCKAIGAGKASLELVKPNMVTLNHLARAQKQTLHVPGVKAVCGTVVSSRSA